MKRHGEFLRFMGNELLIEYLLFVQVQARAQSPNTMPELKVDTKDGDHCVKERVQERLKDWKIDSTSRFTDVQVLKFYYDKQHELSGVM